MCLLIFPENMCRVEDFPMAGTCRKECIVKQQVPSEKVPGQRKRHGIMEMKAWENILQVPILVLGNP